MTNLIVDFPRECNSKVRFSVLSDLWVYERCDDESVKRKVWYSECDFDRMKLEFKRSVQKKYATSRCAFAGRSEADDSSGSASNEELEDPDPHHGGQDEDSFDLLGPNVIRWVYAHREIHRRAVLEEQERQDREGECNPFNIASVSERYSQWSAIRAQRLSMRKTS